ncbi:hypothetical protein NCC49_002969 [Naganishia albida]|nr:hypothetical protein NCC49_002969 [Naganishia albida]
MRFSSLVSVALAVARAIAAPVTVPTESVSRAFATKAGDAPFSLSRDEYDSRIVCPNGVKGAEGGIVFLVHGTALTGEETWATGPFVTILPTKGVQYDVCYIEIPNRSFNDAQLNGEYVAAAIQILAPQSKSGKLFIVGHSQGNINIQWALLYWPSTRSQVSGFSSLAADFKETAEGPLLCIPQMLLQGGCQPSVIQQTIGSDYLKAQNQRGLEALVPTISVYTIQDDIIQPEIFTPTSELPGAATSVSVQELCGLTYLADHFTIPFASPSFYMTYLALTEGVDKARSSLNGGISFLQRRPSHLGVGTGAAVK